MNYCEFVATLPDDTDNPNQHYHDTQYAASGTWQLPPKARANARSAVTQACVVSCFKLFYTGIYLPNVFCNVLTTFLFVILI